MTDDAARGRVFDQLTRYPDVKLRTLGRFDDLYRRHERTIEVCIRGLAQTVARGYMDQDDIRSEAHTTFLRVVRNWRADGGAKFSTMLNQSINRAVVTKVQSLKRRQRWPAFAPAALPEEAEAFLVDRRPVSGQCDELIEQVADRLSHDGYNVLCSLLATKSVTKTARSLAMKKRDVDTVIDEELLPIVFGVTSRPALGVRARRHRQLVTV